MRGCLGLAVFGVFLFDEHVPFAGFADVGLYGEALLLKCQELCLLPGLRFVQFQEVCLPGLLVRLLLLQELLLLVQVVDGFEFLVQERQLFACFANCPGKLFLAGLHGLQLLFG